MLEFRDSVCQFSLKSKNARDTVSTSAKIKSLALNQALYLVEFSSAYSPKTIITAGKIALIIGIRNFCTSVKCKKLEFSMISSHLISSLKICVLEFCGIFSRQEKKFKNSSNCSLIKTDNVCKVVDLFNFICIFVDLIYIHLSFVTINFINMLIFFGGSGFFMPNRFTKEIGYG